MTDLLYLDDTYLFETQATVLDIKKNDDTSMIVLDKTIFYPQGGGQPADVGVITTSNAEFEVTDVRLQQDGTVFHYGLFIKGTIQPSEHVHVSINKEKRLYNARNHSAGHLIDCAIYALGLIQLQPTKAYHFPDGAHVEYEGTIAHANDMVPVLQQEVNALVEKNIPITASTLSVEQAKKDNIWAPPGKSARIIGIGSYPHCGCGGTHVKTTKNIGSVTIRKIKSQKNKTKISYAIEQ